MDRHLPAGWEQDWTWKSKRKEKKVKKTYTEDVESNDEVRLITLRNEATKENNNDETNENINSEEDGVTSSKEASIPGGYGGHGQVTLPIKDLTREWAFSGSDQF